MVKGVGLGDQSQLVPEPHWRGGSSRDLSLAEATIEGKAEFLVHRKIHKQLMSK